MMNLNLQVSSTKSLMASIRENYHTGFLSFVFSSHSLFQAGQEKSGIKVLDSLARWELQQVQDNNHNDLTTVDTYLCSLILDKNHNDNTIINGRK